MLVQVRRPQSFSFTSGTSYAQDWSDKQFLSAKEADSLFRGLVYSYMQLQRLQIQNGYTPITFKGRDAVYNDKTLVHDAPVYLECKEPIRPVHKDFKRRSAAGEILLSPYHNWQAIITYRNGQTVKSRGVPTYSYVEIGRYTGIGTTAGDYILLNGRWYTTRVDTLWLIEYLSEEMSPKQLGWVDPSYKYFDEFVGQQINGPKVQEVLADHNDRTVDALTALAEMPETAKSIIDGLKVIIRMYVDARKKAFRLQNKVSEWKNAKTSDKNRRQVLRNIQELQSAIADVWLNFRYNIEPNKYLIEDLLEAYGAPESLFLRDRSRVSRSVPFYDVRSPWEPNKKATITERVMIKSRLELSSKKFDQQLSFNAFKTAWELVPLSFVIDWVINVGDFITASFPPAHADQGATYSWKVNDDITFTHPQSGASVSIKFTGYNRLEINPSQFCKLYWVPNIDTIRQVDALALSWNIFLERHFRKLS